ncbi:hypothetical protein BD626DRAFT_499586 [Schizophyllum amplum]|uniref:Uncharacterized protein n=1 Tax=Schizophyllum amplum TaxID=97359 RepID=A0A550CB63_9AGAR|nr:hypothetical protein BD626DRAFT_499586 [Auriculariopsis ampla]
MTKSIRCQPSSRLDRASSRNRTFARVRARARDFTRTYSVGRTPPCWARCAATSSMVIAIALGTSSTVSAMAAIGIAPSSLTAQAMVPSKSRTIRRMVGVALRTAGVLASLASGASLRAKARLLSSCMAFPGSRSLSWLPSESTASRTSWLSGSYIGQLR